ncbi:fungal-specific transcription factor domain-containing protein [Phaeosphaeriaceae sp. PMI808]|nr:fungal-specific transcription factor domain-containing protein [Phaeosphaeriaceae sp. PMI808]
MSGDNRVLPACQKCRTRKVRCDRGSPKCGSCTRSNVVCVIVDPVTGAQYARDYIRQLEEQEVRLKQALEEGTPNGQEATPGRGPPTGGTIDSHGGFVGDSSGLGFLHSILSEAKWQQHRAGILSQLAARPQMLAPHLVPNELPRLQEAERLLENYFTRFHIHHTFLLRQDVLDIFNRIYNPSTDSTNKSPQEMFRLLMVFAISSTTRYRAGLSTEHPSGYFLAAERYLDTIPLIKDVDAIQNLLLIARFGMYHHIGASLWEISQLCMRQCIEWRLHTKPTELLSPLLEQHHRRIFWDCYILDRYSSGILGRPFAILESEISVLLPVDVSDEVIMEIGAPELDSMTGGDHSIPTELSVFIFCIKLRKISSRVHTALYTNPDHSSISSNTSGTKNLRLKSIGHVYMAYTQFRKELFEWRTSAPIFFTPRSLYERPEWHDFLYEKDMLLLARGAMHNITPVNYPKSSVSKEILLACYQSASSVIRIYADLMEKQVITWTRSYFQVIFTAGLTVTFCLGIKALEDGLDLHAQQEVAVRTLTLCSDILSFFKEKMPDAGSFTVVFNILRDEYIKDRFRGVRPPNWALSGLRSGLSTEQLNSTLPSANIAVQVDPEHPNLLENFDATQPTDVDQEFGTYDFGLTDNFMTQLEVGMGEYAWGSIPLDENFWDQGYWE